MKTQIHITRVCKALGCYRPSVPDDQAEWFLIRLIGLKPLVAGTCRIPGYAVMGGTK